MAVLAVGQEYASLLPPITHDGQAVAFVWLSPDNRTLLTVGKDYTARLWDARTARQIAILRKGDERVVNCGFSPDGRTVFTDDQKSVARFWDALSGRFRAATEARPNRYDLPSNILPNGDRSALLLNAGAALISGGRLITRSLVAIKQDEFVPYSRKGPSSYGTWRRGVSWPDWTRRAATSTVFSSLASDGSPHSKAVPPFWCFRPRTGVCSPALITPPERS